MKTLARPALRSAATSISTMAGVRIRALTERHPIKPTSPRCHSAWQLNLGRYSTYRRGKSVQTTGTTSFPRRRVSQNSQTTRPANERPRGIQFRASGWQRTQGEVFWRTLACAWLCQTALSRMISAGATSGMGHLQASCAVPSDGGLSPDCFHAGRILLTAESGQDGFNAHLYAASLDFHGTEFASHQVP